MICIPSTAREGSRPTPDGIQDPGRRRPGPVRARARRPEGAGRSRPEGRDPRGIRGDPARLRAGEMAYQDACFRRGRPRPAEGPAPRNNRRPEQFAERFLKLAQERPRTREELFALCWAVVNAPASEPGKKALAILEGGRLADAEPGESVKALDAARTVAGIPALAAGPARAPAGRAEPGRPGVLPELLTWVCRNFYAERVARGAPALRRGRRPPRRSVRRQPGHPELLRVPGQAWTAAARAGPSSTSGISARSWTGTAIDGCCCMAKFALASVVKNAGAARQDEAVQLYESFIKRFEDLSDPRTKRHGSPDDPRGEGARSRRSGTISEDRPRRRPGSHDDRSR